MWSTAGRHSTNEFSLIVSMWVFNNAETQISREGKRYKIPSDIATLSCFVNLCLDTDDSTDGGDTDGNNGKGNALLDDDSTMDCHEITSFLKIIIMMNHNKSGQKYQ